MVEISYRSHLCSAERGSMHWLKLSSVDAALAVCNALPLYLHSTSISQGQLTAGLIPVLNKADSSASENCLFENILTYLLNSPIAVSLLNLYMLS